MTYNGSNINNILNNRKQPTINNNKINENNVFLLINSFYTKMYSENRFIPDHPYLFNNDNK